MPRTRTCLRLAAAALAVVAAVVGQIGTASAGKAVGYDISYPQCGGAYPAKPAFGIVGVGGGRAFDHNPCLASEYQWAAAAGGTPALYMNTGNPGTLSTRWTLPGPQPCSGAADDAGCAYNYGWNNAADAFAYAGTQTPSGVPASRQWWLDVETANSWATDARLNRAAIQGSIDELRSQGVPAVGVYSTANQWAAITGGWALAVPNWVPGGVSAKKASKLCGTGFSGGPVELVQFPSNGFDGDIHC